MRPTSIATALVAFGFFGSLCLAVAVPAPPAVRYVLHEKRTSSIPRLWSRGNRVHGSSILPVRIGLTQNSLETGYDHLMEVSHPSSPRYGKHWTQDEVHDMFAPSEDAVQSVRDWLVESGVASDSIAHSDNKGWLALDIPAWRAEELFRTEYYEHIHSSSGAVRIGCDEYHIPDSIAEHIDLVSPGIKFSHTVTKTAVKRSSLASRYKPGPFKTTPNSDPWIMPLGAESLPTDLQTCGRNITPTCIKALYAIPPASKSDPLNVMGLYEDGDVYAQEDLNLFFAKFAPNVPSNTHPKLDSIDGGSAPVSPGRHRYGLGFLTYI